MLTNAEKEVANYVKAGLSNKEIAERLFVSEKTIKFHTTNIYKKSGVTSRSQLIAQNNYQIPTEVTVSNYVPVSQIRNENLYQGNKPLEQGARQTLVPQKSQEDKITFIDERFKIGETISQLHNMMKEVTKEEINPSTVNAACNCVARLNETINTAIQAARFLNER